MLACCQAERVWGPVDDNVPVFVSPPAGATPAQPVTSPRQQPPTPKQEEREPEDEESVSDMDGANPTVCCMSDAKLTASQAGESSMSPLS